MADGVCWWCATSPVRFDAWVATVRAQTWERCGRCRVESALTQFLVYSVRSLNVIISGFTGSFNVLSHRLMHCVVFKIVFS